MNARVLKWEKGAGSRLPLTLSLVPSSATSSPFLLRHDFDLRNDIMLVSRVLAADAAVAFRTAAADGAVAAVAADSPAVGPPALRFLGFAVVLAAPEMASFAFVFAVPGWAAVPLTAVGWIGSLLAFALEPPAPLVVGAAGCAFLAAVVVAAEETKS